VRIIIRDVGTYSVPRSLDDVPLFVFVRLKRDTGLSRAELEALLGDFEIVDGKPVVGEEFDELLAVGITVWLARRCAGDEGTLEELCTPGLGAITWEVEPGDGDLPTLPGPSPLPKGSSRAGVRVPADRRPKAKAKSSSRRSAAGS
jgi:hypothetical protein